ncbi:MAG: rhamnulokinase, partial [Candidatus Saccharicenans sp.]
MKARDFLAFDLGAESGRAILGQLENDKLQLRLIHRFPNKTILLENHLHWNIYYLFEEIRTVLQKCQQEEFNPISLGVDTWGVDFC